MYDATTNSIILWLSISLLVMGLAMDKDRNAWGWLLFALIIPPLALMMVVLIDPEPRYVKSDSDIAAYGAYRASLNAGNLPHVAMKDGKASRDRINAQNKIRRRYNSDELEPQSTKKNTQNRWQRR